MLFWVNCCCNQSQIRKNTKKMLVLQQMLSNRILSVRIVGESKGTALVGMVDQASDPQADVAELLISIGYAAAATSPPDTEDTDTPGVEEGAAEGRTLVVGVVLLRIGVRFSSQC